MKKFSIKNRKGLNLVVNILIPQNPKGLSFVLHGLSGYKEEKHIELLAEILFENNYIVINFDATNSVNESEGKYEDATMQNHYEDLVDVIDWSKKQEWYKEPFVLAGHSLGGFAVAKYTEEYPEKVKAVFPFAAVFSGKNSFEASNRFNPGKIKEWKNSGWNLRLSNSRPNVEFKLPWSHMEERLTHDLGPNAHKIVMPILFVVGENDQSCPADQQKAFFDLLPKDTEKEFYIIEKAPHVFKEIEHLSQLRNIFDNWLKKIQ